MKTRTLCNLIDADFLPKDKLQNYHKAALASLLAACRNRGHIDWRFASPVLDQVMSDPDICTAWRMIPEGESYDQKPSILCKSAQNSIPGNANGRIVFSTTGSTGAPKHILNAYDEVINNAQIHGKGYAACGIQQDDTVVILGEVGRFASEYAVIHALATTGCTILPIVARERVFENISIMNDLHATAWVAMQSEMFAYLDALEQGKLSPPPLRLIVTGGEPTSPEVISRLKSLFGEALIIRSTFQTADAGTIGYQCANCQEGEFHIHEDLQFVEIVDKNGKPTNEIGRLIVTNLFRYQSPVIRLATGDRAKWCSPVERCGCGRTSKRIKLFGREDKFYKLGGEKIPLNTLNDLVAELNIPPHVGRLVITRKASGQDALTIEVQNQLLSESLKTKVESLFRQNKRLQALVEQDRLAPISVRKLSSEDPLYRGFNKLIRVVDNRSQASK